MPSTTQEPSPNCGNSWTVDDRLTCSLSAVDLISSSSATTTRRSSTVSGSTIGTTNLSPIRKVSSLGAVINGETVGVDRNFADVQPPNYQNYNNNADFQVPVFRPRTSRSSLTSSTSANVDAGKSASQGVGRLLRGVTVEPAIFVHMMVTTIESTVQANLVLHKICQNDIGLPDDRCLYNMSNSTVEEAVQVNAATVSMYITLADTLPGIMMAMLMGAYSDRRGRKFPVIMPIVGYFLSSILFGVFSFYDQLPAIFLCLAVIPRAFGGGLIVFNSSCLSYVSDLSTHERRTERVAFVESALFIGTPIGIIIGGYLADPDHILYAYMLGGALDALVVVYLFVVVHNPPQLKGGFRDHFRDFFDMRNVKLTFAAVVKPRLGNGRMHVLLLLTALFPHLTAFFGSMSVMYLYLRYKYSWDILTFSYFSALSIFSVAIGMLFIVVVFVRALKVSDIVLSITGTIFAIIYNLSVTFNVDAKTIYLVCIPAALSSMGMLAIRAMISKIVPSDEQGKVFSVTASMDAVVPILTSIVYTQLYTAMLTIYPASCFLLSALVLVIPLFILTFIYLDLKVNQQPSVRLVGYTPIDP